MFCFHKWLYAGVTKGYRWLGGVSGGVKIETDIAYKQCTKCGKTKVVNE